MAISYKAIQTDLAKIKQFYKTRRVLDDEQIEDFDEQLKLACRYNKVMEHAPSDLLDVYYHTYIQGMSKSEVNLKYWNVSDKYMQRLYSRLNGYLHKWL